MNRKKAKEVQEPIYTNKEWNKARKAYVELIKQSDRDVLFSEFLVVYQQMEKEDLEAVSWDAIESFARDHGLEIPQAPNDDSLYEDDEESSLEDMSEEVCEVYNALVDHFKSEINPQQTPPVSRDGILRARYKNSREK